MHRGLHYTSNAIKNTHIHKDLQNQGMNENIKQRNKTKTVNNCNYIKIKDSCVTEPLTKVQNTQ